MSTRANVGVGLDVLIAGFIVTGNESKDVVVRAIGSSLEFGGQPLPGGLENPMLEVFDSQGMPVGSNDDWESDPQASLLTSLGIAPTDPQEAALFRTLAPGSYTVVVSGVDETTGIGLAEVYDFSAGNTRLANISTRGNIQTGDNVMIGGFIIGGNDDAKMLIRVRAIALTPLPTNAARSAARSLRRAGNLDREQRQLERFAGGRNHRHRPGADRRSRTGDQYFARSGSRHRDRERGQRDDLSRLVRSL